MSCASSFAVPGTTSLLPGCSGLAATGLLADSSLKLETPGPGSGGPPGARTDPADSALQPEFLGLKLPCRRPLGKRPSSHNPA